MILNCLSCKYKEKKPRTMSQVNRRNKLKVEIKRISNSKFIEQEVQVQIRLASVWKIVQKTVRIASEYS